MVPVLGVWRTHIHTAAFNVDATWTLLVWKISDPARRNLFRWYLYFHERILGPLLDEFIFTLLLSDSDAMSDFTDGKEF